MKLLNYYIVHFKIQKVITYKKDQNLHKRNKFNLLSMNGNDKR